MFYKIFQYGWELDLIQRILIGFEAILENVYLLFRIGVEVIGCPVAADITNPGGSGGPAGVNILPR